MDFFLERAHLYHLEHEVDHAELPLRHDVCAHDDVRLAGVIHDSGRGLDHAHEAGHHHRRGAVVPQDRPRVRRRTGDQVRLLNQRRDSV